jgi:hypothetical protein
VNVVERSGGFANIEGWKFGSVRVLSFAGRNPVRWSVRCERCASTWTENHVKLTQGDYRCKNVACQLGRVQAPRAKHIEPEIETPASIPVPAPRVSDEYRRYQEQMRLWNMEKDIGSYTDFQMLSDEQKGRIMAPVIEAERERELDALAASMEAQERERWRKQYGI